MKKKLIGQRPGGCACKETNVQVQIWLAALDEDCDLSIFKDLQILTPICLYATNTTITLTMIMQV